MKSSTRRVVLVCFFAGACGAKSTQHLPEDPRLLTLTDSAAARLSAPELIRLYVDDRDPAAIYLSSLQCPTQSARSDSLFSGLLNLPPAGNRARDYALSWSNNLTTCRDPRIVGWYRDAMGRARDDLTIVLLTRSLLRARDSLDIAAVKMAAFDTANNSDARQTILSMLVDELYYSGQQRVDLMIESYRRTGDVPGGFITDQAARRWLLRTNWREALLAEIVAAPSKHGAAPLLLTLAQVTREASRDARWRSAWETGLQVLEKHPDATSNLKSMIPIARDVAQQVKN